MKTKFKFKRAVPFAGMAALVFGILLFSQCKKEDVVDIIPNVPTIGTDVMNTYDGSWGYDESHSAVNWALMYKGDGAWLTGKFDGKGVDVNFSEANPSAGKIEAWVQLSTCNTGESARDKLTGCLNGYLGVEHNGDTLANGDPDPAGIDSLTDYAYFTSTSIERYGDGYRAIGNFEFNGVTKPQTLYFNYLGQADHSDPPDGSQIKGALLGTMKFNAVTDYGVTSTSISDEIELTISVNLKKL